MSNEKKGISEHKPWYLGRQDKSIVGGSSLLYSDRYNVGLGTYRRQLDRHPPRSRKGGAKKLQTRGTLLLATENLHGPSKLQGRQGPHVQLIQSAPSLLESLGGSLDTTDEWTSGFNRKQQRMGLSSGHHDLRMTVNQSGVMTSGPMTELQAALGCCRGTQNIEKRAKDRAERLESHALATRRRQAKDHADWLITGTLQGTNKKPSPVAVYADEQAAHYGLTTQPNNPWRRQMNNPTAMNKVRKRQVKAVGGMACVMDRMPLHNDPNDDKVFAEVIAGVERELHLRYRILWEEMAEILWHLHKREFSLPGDQTIDLLHKAMETTASENPDPRLLSRSQFLHIARNKLVGCPEQSLARAFSGLDPRRTDRVRYARFSALLVAGYRPEGQDKIMNAEVIEEFKGPHKRALQTLSRMYELYKDPLTETISLEDVRLIFLSCVRSDDDLKAIDGVGKEEDFWDQTRLNVKWNGYSQHRCIQDRKQFIDEVKLRLVLLDVFQEQLDTFQRFIKHEFRKKGRNVTTP